MTQKTPPKDQVICYHLENQKCGGQDTNGEILQYYRIDQNEQSNYTNQWRILLEGFLLYICP